MLTQSQIKWLATAIMVIDHVGLIWNLEPLQIIGRLSFPMFAWVFAQNWKRPGEKKALIKRLIGFGLLSHVPYILAFWRLEGNIMLTFTIAAVCFGYIRKSTENKRILILALGLIGAEFSGTGYGWYGVACPLLMLSLKEQGSRMWWIGWIVTNIIYATTSGSFIQLFAILTPVVLAYHNPEKDRQPTAIEKKFFYYFYPIHLAGLAALRTIV